MASNKNIFFATNPAHITDALWHLIDTSGVALQDILIFLPSRRAIRTVEKMLVKKHGHAVILPHLVPLGTGVDDADEYEPSKPDIISNTERVVLLARLLSADKNIKNISTALPIARDLIRMTDYLENEGIDFSTIDWADSVDEKYAEHFQDKAKILSILSEQMPAIIGHRQTTTQMRNADIRAWIDVLNKENCRYKLVVVCGSTASVPATADLMAAIAKLPFGKIILSGKIGGRESDFVLPTNPYCSEYAFLNRIEYKLEEIQPIDVGSSETIDFMNASFGNDPRKPDNPSAVSHCYLVECDHESVEALAVAEIAQDAIKEHKSVLVITPDAAANQRIATAFDAYGINADFSSGHPATMHAVGRAILNLFDKWIEKNPNEYTELYDASNHDLFNMVVDLVDTHHDIWFPSFNSTDENAIPIWMAIKELSDALQNNGIVLSLADARAFIFDTLSGVVMRVRPTQDTPVCVLGTIESRMQSADVVIMTGLNDGMFPARGYENAWLPLGVSERIGLPSPDRKVSLMSLDFMNLSCCARVYWLRSKISGDVKNIESRFISRVTARGGMFDKSFGEKLVSKIHSQDNVPPKPLNYDAPTPPPDWSEVYVTELEKLIHNPYVFYVGHILRLNHQDDYWETPDGRKFGTLVHDVARVAEPGVTPEILVSSLDTAAKKLLGNEGTLFKFWHKRFVDFAPKLAEEINENPNAQREVKGSVDIPVGDNGATRRVSACADRVWDGVVMDIKTGALPTESQLKQGNVPQLPIEAYILQSGGFDIPTTALSQTPVIKFLQLHSSNIGYVTYNATVTAEMVSTTVEKVKGLFNMYTAGNAPYEYHENSNKKYKIFDDLARVDDL